MKKRDDTKRKYFPGDAGNPFDVILHSLEKIERIPAIGFALILLFLAGLLSYPNIHCIFILVGFFALDWFALIMLPVSGKSFGPPKPPTLILAILRGIFWSLPISLPTAIGLQLIGTSLVIYGFWLEPHQIRVAIQKINIKGMDSLRPLRILHLGDLHIERITPREIELNRMIKHLAPDLILFSGDFLNLSHIADPLAIQDARRVISDWSAPMGVYAVAGSPAVDLAESIQSILAGLPVNFLHNQLLHLDFSGFPFTLIGLQSTQRPHIEGPILQKLMDQETPGSYKILLYHTPDLAPEASAAGVNLQLSGHTHGGQVRLPLIGALVTGSIYGKRFEAGRYQVGEMVLYVTRGIGMEGGGAPRVRFLCPPEIILWEITGTDSEMVK